MAMNKKEYQIALGKNLKKIREAKGMGLQELAIKCNKERQSIDKVEKGTTNPTTFYMYEIAQALGVEVSELYKF